MSHEIIAVYSTRARCPSITSGRAHSPISVELVVVKTKRNELIKYIHVILYTAAVVLVINNLLLESQWRMGRGAGGGVGGPIRAAVRRGRQNWGDKEGIRHLTTFRSGKIAVRHGRR